jgi:hypothetical protein
MGNSATQLPVPPTFLALLERFKGRFGARFAESGALRGRPRIERPLSFALPPPHADDARTADNEDDALTA